jgi:phage tail protein X
MTLERAFQTLWVRLRAARDSLDSLRMTIVEDRPTEGDAALVDLLGDVTLDIHGFLEEALSAAEEGLFALSRDGDLDRARRALGVCQERYSRLFQRYATDLVRYERIADVARLGRERGGEWRGWARGVRAALDACTEPLFEANQALVACWQDLAERATVAAMPDTAAGTGTAELGQPRPRSTPREG